MKPRLTNPTLIAASAALLAGGAVTANAKVDAIDGAGATFPYPVYSKWAQAYKDEKGVKLNYQAIGSGGGIKQIKAKTVDFGASDAPLKQKELEKAGLMQFPAVMGGVVPVVNAPGVAKGDLTLDGKTFAKIYLGKIKKWNAPAIQKLNPDVDLPDKKITVVHRSDGSGTTWIFTSYLSKVSDAWKNGPGHAKSVAWPAGVGGKGNQGVASYVNRIKGSIGYVEYAYALQNDMAWVQMKNKAGGTVQPNIESFQSAASHADWKNAPGFYMVLTNEPGKESWPITAASYILMHKEQADPQVAQAVLKFYNWSYKQGDEMAKNLDYVPLPSGLIKQIRAKWESQLQGEDGSSVWPPK
ncbi:phosphate ABC transporter substrate-binding protein PstS [Salinisphaera sp. USBA-960]|uniref:phosphate ABC transporter substrate-binding protein PstS n=1 Tax=Salinisphaera orenii TaxID=856731 RepID=UPI000DBE1562|nr:phosphate ABC transporter substrate-binding protein PstS [Salifodinibacter halophilus]NNC26562.1 phosphate ABC transporter substrate-binding protein PstS [Salifodinibacter halophilus]